VRRVLSLLLVAAVTAGLQAMQAPPDHGGHRVLAPDALEWAPLGPTMAVAVLSGVPQQEGSPFVLRLKLAAGATVPPHWHPVDEHLTVLSGRFHMGMGERFDKGAGSALAPGAYAVMPKSAIHFAWVDDETVVQIHGVGPFKTNFVEPLPTRSP
jgi:quercetin dioxygenase-like cupin family protein